MPSSTLLEVRERCHPTAEDNDAQGGSSYSGALTSTPTNNAKGGSYCFHLHDLWFLPVASLHFNNAVAISRSSSSKSMRNAASCSSLRASATGGGGCAAHDNPPTTTSS